MSDAAVAHVMANSGQLLPEQAHDLGKAEARYLPGT